MKSLHVWNQDCKLQVWEAERKGETILFLHPQGGCSSIWKDMLPHFSENYHLVCMDLRGQGESDRAATGYDIETQCADILAVLDSLQIEKAHLIGNSLGGDFATFFAAKHPERMLTLINLDSAMIDYLGANGECDETREEVLEYYRNRERPGFDSREQFAAQARETWWDEWHPYYEKWFEHVSIYPLDDGQITYRIPNEINVQIMETVCDLRYEDAYQQMKCPVLFLPATNEQKLEEKLTLIERVREYFPCKVAMIPDSKHLMPIDQPDAVSQEILTFLKEKS
jgi:2-succinyl-6-hydroxy-2,4-cyclohexadiene-1-carboxylate synthase